MTKVATFVSYIFYPATISIVVSLLYFLLQPTYIYKPQQYLMLAVIGIITFIFPLLILFILKRFKMINNYYMTTIKERKFPLLLFICISAIISNYLFKTGLVSLLAFCYFGYTIALIVCYFLLNLNIKSSLYTVTISSATLFFTFFSYYYKINLLLLIGVLCTLTGLVITTKLAVKRHTSTEVYSGFIIGIVSQLIVVYFFSF